MVVTQVLVKKRGSFTRELFRYHRLRSSRGRCVSHRHYHYVVL